MVDDFDFGGDRTSERSERDRSAERSGESGKGKTLPDSLRKALVTGVSALFVTEEGIRNMLSELRLPKEAMAYLVQQTERSRRELYRVVSDEVKGFLKNVDLRRELRRALTGLKVEVKAEVRFIDESETQSHVKTRVSGSEHADRERDPKERERDKDKDREKDRERDESSTASPAAERKRRAPRVDPSPAPVPVDPPESSDDGA